jgi:hypothetical protein
VGIWIGAFVAVGFEVEVEVLLGEAEGENEGEAVGSFSTVLRFVGAGWPAFIKKPNAETRSIADMVMPITIFSLLLKCQNLAVP